MKEIMIKICGYMEEKYMDEITKIIYEKDPQLHYDINLE
jgi:hypothetical protein